MGSSYQFKDVSPISHFLNLKKKQETVGIGVLLALFQEEKCHNDIIKRNVKSVIECDDEKKTVEINFKYKLHRLQLIMICLSDNYNPLKINKILMI